MSSPTRTASAFSVLYINQFGENNQGEPCNFAPHVTCGYRKGLPKSMAHQLHEALCEIVNRFPDPRIRVLDEQVELGRPGNPKVIGFAARLEPKDLHEAVTKHAELNEDGPFKVWKPHVSVHMGKTLKEFRRDLVDKSFPFGVETQWNKRHTFTQKAREDRYPRVRRVDGKDDEPIIRNQD